MNRTQVTYDGDPWNRQPFDSSKSFAAFQVFLEMPASERSLAKLAQQVSLSERWLKEWSRQHHWQERAMLFERSQFDLRRRAREQEHARELREYVSQQKQVARATLQIALQLLDVSNRALNQLRQSDAAGSLSYSQVCSVLRTAAQVADSCSNAQAQALGVEELLTLLDEPAAYDETQE
jgi:hypothetical protein